MIDSALVHRAVVKRGVAVALAAVLVSASPVAASPGWDVVPLQPGSANLVDVTALSAHDVWAAGFAVNQEIIDGRPYTTFEPQVQHGDGVTWSAVPTAPLGKDVHAQFAGIAAAAPDRIWAVGHVWEPHAQVRSLIEHWNGVTWTRVPADDMPDAGHALSDVAAVGAADVWAVGTFANAENSGPVAQHWDGVRWTRVPLPPGLDGAALEAVAAAGPADVWAAGLAVADQESGRTEPLLLHWDGVAWCRVALPDTADRGSALLDAVTVSRGQVWAVGESTMGGPVDRRPLAFRIDGRRAALEPTPDEQGQLNGVTTVGREVWAVGYHYDEARTAQAYALRRGPDGTWRRAPVPAREGATLFGVTTERASGTLWTSGAMTGTGTGQPEPLVARFR